LHIASAADSKGIGEIPQGGNLQTRIIKMKRVKKTITAEEFDALFDSGADVSEYIDWDSARRPGLEDKQRQKGGISKSKPRIRRRRKSNRRPH
jgi:hypothetical protein